MFFLPFQFSNNHCCSAFYVIAQNMQIPLSYADAVIGVNGANISYIRRTSGATIAIQETRGLPGEMTVEINGSASQVLAAQQLVQVFPQNFVEYYNSILLSSQILYC